MLRVLLFLLICNIAYGLNKNDRRPSDPYISGDTFRAACDFVYDETSDRVNIHNARYGSTYFVKIDLVGEFFKKIHPRIPRPYVLVTHNGDIGAPGPYVNFLNDPKLLAWFALNPNVEHPKLHPIPIGVANRHWPQGDVDMLHQVKNTTIEKSHLVYMNFAVATYPKERGLVFDLFKNAPYCYTQPAKGHGEYLRDVAASKFVLSPRGNGLDCHRTWEALWLGAIPIVRTSLLDPLFEGLPVWVVNEWTEVTEPLLQKKWAEHLVSQYDFEKIYFDYWLRQINSFKNIP